MSAREYDRIVSSIKAVGLLEPLVVYPECDGFLILDGVQRYRALLDMGVEVVPCLLGKQREAFTGNRMAGASKLYQPVGRRRIPHHRIDGKILLTDDDVATFLAGCRVEVTAPATPQHRLRLKHLHLN